MSETIDTEQIHRKFVKQYMVRQREKFVEELRRAKADAENEPIPEAEHRRAQVISDAVRNIIVGGAKRGNMDNG